MQEEEIRILRFEKVDNGLLVTFTDGASALFHAEFLYANQQKDKNLQIERPGGKPAGLP